MADHDAIYFQLTCIREIIEAQYTTLSYEYGRASQGVLGPALDGPEFIENVRVTETKPEEVDRYHPGYLDFTSVLGRPATRGEVTNLGDNPAYIYFVRDDEKAETPARLGPYILPAATTRAITRFTDAVLVLAAPVAEGETPLEVWVQADVQ